MYFTLDDPQFECIQPISLHLRNNPPRFCAMRLRAHNICRRISIVIQNMISKFYSTDLIEDIKYHWLHQKWTDPMLKYSRNFARFTKKMIS